MSSQERLENLIKWASQNKVQISPNIEFEITPSNGTRAVYDGTGKTESSTGLSDSELLKIPQNVLITSNLAKSVLSSTVGNIDKWDPERLLKLLIAKLRFDSNATSDAKHNYSAFYQPYIEYLPSSRDLNIPFFWNEKEASLLQNTDAQHYLHNRLRSLHEEWSQLTQSMAVETKGFAKFSMVAWYAQIEHEKDWSWSSFPAYVWAHCILTSRGFPEAIINDNALNLNTPMLVPVLDLLNHDNNAKVDWRKTQIEGVPHVTFNNSLPLQQGKHELFNNYGDKPNIELLFGYGFVIDRNDYDATTITIGMPPEIITQANKIGLDSPEIQSQTFSITNDKLVNDDMVKLIQVFMAPECESPFNIKTKLEALDELVAIVEMKTNHFKLAKEHYANIPNQSIVQTAKVYRNTQRILAQKSTEELQKVSKRLFNKIKPPMFKKSLYKTDQLFQRMIERFYNLPAIEAAIERDLFDYIIILYILKCASKTKFPKCSTNPPWIESIFNKIKSQVGPKPRIDESIRSIYYDKMKVPQLAASNDLSCDFSIEAWYVADKVYDSIVYVKGSNKEVYLVDSFNWKE